MPTRVLWIYVEQLAVIEARRSIQRINEMSYAFGGMKPEDARGFMRKLEIEASNHREPRVATRPKSTAEMLALAGAGGVKVDMG